MLDALAFSWLLLPLGAALGWYIARLNPPPSASADSPPPAASQQYLSGLAHLANEDPDQALAALLHAAENDPGTVELQLTLGSLFRKRGEVDRALRLHEGLLARPQLTPAQAAQARFELAQDYIKAGVMDRAETLLNEMAVAGVQLGPALEQLVAIQEQAQEWSKAIETARRLEPVKGLSLRPQIAHYHCELAEEARRRKDSGEAVKLAARALSEDPTCVRASLLAAALAEAAGDSAAAAKAYRRVPEQDPRFLGEILEPLQRSHEKLGTLLVFREFLDEAEERWSHPGPMIAKGKLMFAEGKDPTVYLTERLQKLPDWRGLDVLFDALARQSDTLAPTINGLRAALRKTYEAAAPYRCTHCGLTPRLLFWKCPSCKQWGSVVPVSGLADSKQGPSA